MPYHWASSAAGSANYDRTPWDVDNALMDPRLLDLNLQNQLDVQLNLSPNLSSEYLCDDMFLSSTNSTPITPIAPALASHIPPCQSQIQAEPCLQLTNRHPREQHKTKNAATNIGIQPGYTLARDQREAPEDYVWIIPDSIPIDLGREEFNPYDHALLIPETERIRDYREYRTKRNESMRRYRQRKKNNNHNNNGNGATGYVIDIDAEVGPDNCLHSRAPVHRKIQPCNPPTRPLPSSVLVNHSSTTHEHPNSSHRRYQDNNTNSLMATTQTVPCLLSPLNHAQSSPFTPPTASTSSSATATSSTILTYKPCEPSFPFPKPSPHSIHSHNNRPQPTHLPPGYAHASDFSVPQHNHGDEWCPPTDTDLARMLLDEMV